MVISMLGFGSGGLFAYMHESNLHNAKIKSCNFMVFTVM